MKARLLALVVVVGTIPVSAQSHSISAAMDAYLDPYVRSNNFSGVVLVERNGRPIFSKAYGLSDREQRIPTRTDARFHIASISMQFTAAAIMRLADEGKLKLDDTVASYIPSTPGAGWVTIRDLLTQRPGLTDINSLPDYDDVMQHHQTQAALVAAIESKALRFEPGSKYLHEEHSAYDLLALIVEKKTQLPFAGAMQQLVFKPLELANTGIDDDSLAPGPQLAKGYQPEGTYGLKPAIHWFAKAGSPSVITTAGDQARWVVALFTGKALSAASRSTLLDTAMRVGFGWFKGQNQRFNQTAYYMKGRSPGFSSFVLYLPDGQLTVVMLSNIYSSATTKIGNDLAAILLGLGYSSLAIAELPPTSREL